MEDNPAVGQASGIVIVIIANRHKYGRVLDNQYNFIFLRTIWSMITSLKIPCIHLRVEISLSTLSALTQRNTSTTPQPLMTILYLSRLRTSSFLTISAVELLLQSGIKNTNALPPWSPLPKFRLLHSFRRVSQVSSITLVNVPGPSGICQNEMVEKVAKQVLLCSSLLTLIL